jgi:FAD:protein FMN transferase
MKRRTFISAALGLGAAGLGMTLAPRHARTGEITRVTGGAHPRSYAGAALAFGTTISIEVVHSDQRQAELAIEDALAAAKKIDRLMTLHRPDSQVALLNRHGFLDRPDPHLQTVLASGAKLSRLTNGAFDVTVQPLWLAYSAAAARAALPSAGERDAAMGLVGWRQLACDERRVALLRPGMAITLNGIAQGYGLDLARAALQARGIRHALLDTGEFAASGRNGLHQPWTVGIRAPRDPRAVAGVLAMDGRCVATSGDYESAFTPDFMHHHILDPASGDSPTELASVTVVAPTGLEADGWSTALMVLGAEKARALAPTLDKVDVLLIGKDGRQWRSARLPLRA